MLSVTERRFHFRGKKYSKMCLNINWYLKTTLIFVFHGRRKHRWSRTSTTERWIQPFALPKCFYLFCLKEGKSFLGFFRFHLKAHLSAVIQVYSYHRPKNYTCSRRMHKANIWFLRSLLTVLCDWKLRFSIDAQFVICLCFRHRWLHFIPLPAWS